MPTDPTIYVYAVVVLMAAGSYALLVRKGQPVLMSGMVLVMGGLAGIIVQSVMMWGGQSRTDLFFYFFAVLTLGSAVGVITQTKAVYSALLFMMVVLSSAGMMLLLEAEFLATALVIVYGGAILVTYVFVIMLAQQSIVAGYDRKARNPLAACFFGFMLVAVIGSAAVDQFSKVHVTVTEELKTIDSSSSNTELLGAMLLTRYAVVLELAGVLLLLAMVGAIAIARKQFPADAVSGVDERMKIGELGRKAVPF